MKAIQNNQKIVDFLADSRCSLESENEESGLMVVDGLYRTEGKQFKARITDILHFLEAQGKIEFKQIRPQQLAELILRMEQIAMRSSPSKF